MAVVLVVVIPSGGAPTVAIKRKREKESKRESFVCAHVVLIAPPLITLGTKSMRSAQSRATM